MLALPDRIIRRCRLIRFLVWTLAVAAVLAITVIATVIAQNDGWVSVGSWEGRGAATTETFTVAGGEWRIRWDARAILNTGEMELSIIVYDRAGTLVFSASASRPGPGMSYIKGTGRYSISMNSENADWMVTAEHKP